MVLCRTLKKSQTDKLRFPRWKKTVKINFEQTKKLVRFVKEKKPTPTFNEADNERTHQLF
jgi:hypothetical protein